jgi:hypothetical protein
MKNSPRVFSMLRMNLRGLNTGDKKDKTIDPWQKIKGHRQIVAIGKSLGAMPVISGDRSGLNNALLTGMQGITTQDLELREAAKQQ